MTSSRLILLFLGIIFLLILILSSNKIGGFLHQKFGRFLPSFKPPFEEVITPSPTFSPSPSPSPTQAKKKELLPSPTIEEGARPPEIPATGAKEDLTFLLIGSLLLGVLIRKISLTVP